MSWNSLFGFGSAGEALVSAADRLPKKQSKAAPAPDPIAAQEDTPIERYEIDKPLILFTQALTKDFSGKGIYELTTLFMKFYERIELLSSVCSRQVTPMSPEECELVKNQRFNLLYKISLHIIEKLHDLSIDDLKELNKTMAAFRSTPLDGTMESYSLDFLYNQLRDPAFKIVSEKIQQQQKEAKQKANEAKRLAKQEQNKKNEINSQNAQKRANTIQAIYKIIYARQKAMKENATLKNKPLPITLEQLNTLTNTVVKNLVVEEGLNSSLVPTREQLKEEAAKLRAVPPKPLGPKPLVPKPLVPKPPPPKPAGAKPPPPNPIDYNLPRLVIRPPTGGKRTRKSKRSTKKRSTRRR